jgi:YgiT-type zinc finger domain-containing protein
MSEHCSFCGHAHLDATTSRYIHQQGDDILIVDDVPCLRCGYCGEEYYDIATLKRIEADHEALSAGRRRPVRTVQVAVEPFAAI